MCDCGYFYFVFSLPFFLSLIAALLVLAHYYLCTGNLLLFLFQALPTGTVGPPKYYFPQHLCCAVPTGQIVPVNRRFCIKATGAYG